MYKPPILIDEAQKAPELFEQIKILCDESDERGRFWLTGSQSKKLIKRAGDSLAGRICILRMFSLSDKEIAGTPDDILLDFSLASLVSCSQTKPANNILDIYTRIWEGGMPDMIGMDTELRRAYWNSYIDSYLLRDAVDDNGIADTKGFRKFLRACAAFTGKLLNYNDLGSAAGVSGVTAKEWVKVLQSMGIIFRSGADRPQAGGGRHHLHERKTVSDKRPSQFDSGESAIKSKSIYIFLKKRNISIKC